MNQNHYADIPTSEGTIRVLLLPYTDSWISESYLAAVKPFKKLTIDELDGQEALDRWDALNIKATVNGIFIREYFLYGTCIDLDTEDMTAEEEEELEQAYEENVEKFESLTLDEMVEFIDLWEEENFEARKRIVVQNQFDNIIANF